jgi:hypothetical protein
MAQKTEVEIGVRDKATTELKGIAGAFEKMRVSVETNNKGINKLDNAFRGLGAQAASLPGPLGRVADALADFAPGGLAGGAALAGLGLIAIAINNHIKNQEKIKEEQDKVSDSAKEQYLAYVKLTGGVELYNAELNKTEAIIARNDIKKFTDQLVELEKKIRADATAIALFNNDMGAAGGRVMTQSTLENALAQARRGNLAEYLQALRGLQQANTAFANATSNQTELENNQAKKRRDNANRALAEEEKLNRARRARAEALARIEKETLDELFAINMKYYEDLANARQFSRQFISEDIGNQLKVNLGDVDKTILGIEEAAKKAQTAADERMKSIEPIVYGISDGFDTMIDGLMSGENAFKSFGQGARSAISGILKALAQQNLVEGLGALGKAFAAAANPLTAPSAPGFFKSAAQHFAAAAAAGVGARAVGGAGGGGIGANGGAFNNSQLGRNSFNNQQQPLTIVIQGGLLDMSNPDTQRSFVGALETVTNRRIKVNTMGI